LNHGHLEILRQPALHAAQHRRRDLSKKELTQAGFGYLEAVPVHPEAEVDASTTADCFLQIWELDYYKTDRYLTNEETDLGPRKNQLITSIPGVVVKKSGKAGGHEFRSTGAPTPARDFDPLNGKVILGLKPAGEDKPKDVQLNLPEYEGVLELAASLRLDGEDQSFGAEREMPPYQVKNVEASLRRQVTERGGFAISFVANYRAASAPDKLPAGGDAEFERQAEDMIDVLPTFKSVGGKLACGYHLVNGPDEIPGLIEQARKAANSLLKGPANSAGPKVSVLALYCHGIASAMKLNAYAKLRIAQIPALVSGIQGHVSDQLVMPLFACNTGRGPKTTTGSDHYDDASYSILPPAEEPGGDSFAWTLFHELRRNGVTHATVWGHTTAAHTTRNPYLRVFSSQGLADFANVVLKKPLLDRAKVKQHFLGGVFHCTDSQPMATYRARLHNANLLRAICLQNGLYLPWSWNGRTDADDTVDGFNAAAQVQARAIYGEICGLLPAIPSKTEEVLYEDDSRRFIVGILSPLVDSQLSEHLKFSEIPTDAQPFRIKVQLLRYFQLLRRRANLPIQIIRLLDSGEGLAIQPASNAPANFKKLEAKAKEMVAQGLLTSVEDVTEVPLRSTLGIFHRD
jgi:hypothetical protein